ncbi:MAG: hypothetical protein ACK40Z_15035, partial [Dietzia sp.]
MLHVARDRMEFIARALNGLPLEQLKSAAAKPTRMLIWKPLNIVNVLSGTKQQIASCARQVAQTFQTARGQQDPVWQRYALHHFCDLVMKKAEQLTDAAGAHTLGMFLAVVGTLEP